jgi:hypothetical protein
MEATVYVDRWDPARREYMRQALATMPVIRALRAAREIAARNPVHATWDLRAYARPITTRVRLGAPSPAWAPGTMWTSPDDLMTFEADIRYEPSIGDLISTRGWAAV